MNRAVLLFACLSVATADTTGPVAHWTIRESLQRWEAKLAPCHNPECVQVRNEIRSAREAMGGVNSDPKPTDSRWWPGWPWR